MSEPKTKLDISDLKDTFLECPVCVEHFNQTDRRPRLLHSCLHAFCTPCLQKLLEKEGQGQITCPLCRQVQKVEDNAESLPGDPLRSKLVEYVDVQKKKSVLCSECSEQRDAISRCQDCQTYLCKECDFIHRGHRSTRDHSPISVQEALAQPIKDLSTGHFCPKHQKHHVEFYCTTDEHLCCVSCTVVDHKGHDLQSLEEAAASRIADIETSLANARGQADNLRESKKICKRNEKHIQNDMESTLSDINTVFDDLLTRLNRRRKILTASVKEKGNSLLSSVHKASEALDETLAVIESTNTYFTQAKDKADVVEVLQIYPALKRSLSNVQNIPSVTSSKKVEKLTFVKPTKDSIDVFVSGFDARSVGHGRISTGPGTATGKNITVQVYTANILQTNVDVIVNAANGQLCHGGGVARAIAAAAGDRMKFEGDEIVRQRGDIGVTDLAVTSAGKLPYKNIFHAVGPAWRDYKDKAACLEDVCKTVLRCLCEARKRNISSIAILAISSSIFKVPQDMCAMMYIRAVKSFDQTVNGGPRIDVHFVDINDKMVDIISRELDTNWSQPLGQDELDRDAAFIRQCLGAESVTSVITSNSGNSSTKPVDPLHTDLQGVQETGFFKFSENVEEFIKYLRTAMAMCVLQHQCSSVTMPVYQDIVSSDSSKLKLTVFIESIVDALSGLSREQTKPTLHLHMVDNQQSVVDELCEGLHKYLVSSGLIQTGQMSTEGLLTPGGDPCSICLETVTDPVKLKCGDVFCKPCIDKAFAVKKVCPNCKAVCGIITGNMPYGTMTTRTDYRSLPGYSNCDMIVIKYHFPGGKQTGAHPNPGKPYKGAKRTAYLPDNFEGRKVLALLKIAWDRKLTFTVGTSVTISDGQDRVTWNEIHHKTEITGGPTNHGYPDADYLKRVTEELAAQGVTEDDLFGSS